MKIVAVEVLPFAAGGQIGATAYRRAHAAVKVLTDEGLTGISRIGPEAGPYVAAVLAPELVGQDPANVERLWERMYAAVARSGSPRPGAVGMVGSLDVALWDLLGKQLNRPVWQLLGGLRDRVEAYADALPVVPRRESAAGLAAAMAGYVGAGFKAVKLHLPRFAPDEVSADLGRVREAIGPQTRLMVDVHRRWDPWTAVEMARRLEPLDVYWFEEPVSWDDQVGGLAFVASRIRQLVAGAEGEHSLHVCRDYVARGAVHVLQADVLGAGGFTAWRRIAAVAQAYHVRAAPHGASFPELNAHLVASLPNGLIVSAFPAGEPYEVWSRLYREPVQIREGQLQLTGAPGLGLELDEAFIARHRP
jgi:L-alanine-DL-glutamate epimerase-like enolase superfamily enzyme